METSTENVELTGELLGRYNLAKQLAAQEGELATQAVDFILRVAEKCRADGHREQAIELLKLVHKVDSVNRVATKELRDLGEDPDSEFTVSLDSLREQYGNVRRGKAEFAEAVADRLAAAGRHSDDVEWCTEMVAHHPLSDVLWQHLLASKAKLADEQTDTSSAS